METIDTAERIARIEALLERIADALDSDSDIEALLERIADALDPDSELVAALREDAAAKAIADARARQRTYGA